MSDPRSRGLGRTQVLVLRLLAAGDAKSVRNLAYDWPELTESAARSAVMRLGNRSLVDVAGWDSTDGRTYTLTERGRALEAALNVDEDEGLSDFAGKPADRPSGRSLDGR